MSQFTKIVYVNVNAQHVAIVGSKSVGDFRAIAAGLFAFLKPLSPGTHDVEISRSVINPSISECNTSSEAHFRLTVI